MQHHLHRRALAKRRDPDPTIEGGNQWTAMLLKR
jgi:hypothetical protein